MKVVPKERVQLRASLLHRLKAVIACNGGSCYNGPIDHAHYDGPWGLHAERRSALYDAIEELGNFTQRHATQLNETELRKILSLEETYVMVSQNDANDRYERQVLDSSAPKNVAAAELKRRTRAP